MTARSNGRLAGWIALVGALSALSYVGRFTGGKAPHDALYRYSTAVSEISLFAVILALVLTISRGADRRQLSALRRPRSWRQAAWIALGVLVAVFALESILDPLLHAGREQGLTPHGWKPGSAGPFAANVVAFAIVVTGLSVLAPLTWWQAQQSRSNSRQTVRQLSSGPGASAVRSPLPRSSSSRPDRGGGRHLGRDDPVHRG